MAELNKSKRDLYRERFSKRYPDLNMDDEDAYYDQHNAMFDEYEGYERNTQKMRDRLKDSPILAEMIVAAGESQDFDPIVWMVEKHGLDLDALRDNPQYSKQLADAHATYLDNKSKAEEIERKVAENMPKSVDAVKAKAAELGLTDEQAAEIVGDMYRVMDDLIVGVIDPDIFELMSKGKNHDQDVENAHDVGLAEGLNKKIDDKLRTLPASNERISGRQAPTRPKRDIEVNNPFV